MNRITDICFSMMKRNSDNEGNRFQFTGHEQDGETAYEYHGARYYNRTLGRYLSVDPLAIQFAGHTPYNYVLGNPIMLIDPDGMALTDWITTETFYDNRVQNQEDATALYLENGAVNSYPSRQFL